MSRQRPSRTRRTRVITLPQLLSTAVEADPDGVAVVLADATGALAELTYAELDERSTRLARLLIARGIGPEDLVAVAFPRSLEAVIALWAVAKSGAGFVPVDPADPAQRIAHLVVDSGVVLGLTVAAARDTLPGTTPWLAVDTAEFAVELEKFAADPVTYADRLRPLRAEHPASVVYTIDAIGAPHGVVVTQAGLSALCDAQRARHRVDGDSRTLSFAAPAHDAAVLELLLAVGGAATMVVAAPSVRGGDELAALLLREDVTHAYLPSEVLESIDPSGLDELRVVICAGRSYPPELVDHWTRPIGAGPFGAAVRRFLHGYGAAETTVLTNVGTPHSPAEASGLGAPNPGTTEYVLDERLSQTPDGETGELYVAGAQLARGYLRRPSQTAAHFVANPFLGGSGADSRLFRTGDLVRRTPEGTIEYVGPASPVVAAGVRPGVRNRLDRSVAAAHGESVTASAVSPDLSDEITAIHRPFVPPESPGQWVPGAHSSDVRDRESAEDVVRPYVGEYSSGERESELRSPGSARSRDRENPGVAVESPSAGSRDERGRTPENNARDAASGDAASGVTAAGDWPSTTEDSARDGNSGAEYAGAARGEDSAFTDVAGEGVVSGAGEGVGRSFAAGEWGSDGQSGAVVGGADVVARSFTTEDSVPEDNSGMRYGGAIRGADSAAAGAAGADRVSGVLEGAGRSFVTDGTSGEVGQDTRAEGVDAAGELSSVTRGGSAESGQDVPGAHVVRGLGDGGPGAGGPSGASGGSDRSARAESGGRGSDGGPGAVNVPVALGVTPMPRPSTTVEFEDTVLPGVPLSAAQQRMWRINRSDPDSVAHNVCFAVRISGRMRVEALQVAVVDVIERHEMLRTVYPVVDGSGYQVVLPLDRVLADLTPEPLDEAEIEDWLGEYARIAFDATVEIPVRIGVAQITPDEHVVVVVAHRIAADEASVTPFLRDLAVALLGRRNRARPSWSPLAVQYADYALWQRAALGDAADPDSTAGREIAYWRETLAGLVDGPDLPADRPRLATPSGHAAAYTFSVGRRTHAGLVELARTAGGTLFTAVHAGFAALLGRLSGDSDIAVGTTDSGRGVHELDGAIGLFENPLVLRTRIDATLSFAELLAAVTREDLSAFEHAGLPFGLLAEALGESARPYPSWLRVALTVREPDRAQVSLPGLSATAVEFDSGVAEFELRLSVFPREEDGVPGGLSATFTYATDLFDEITVAGFAERLALLFDAVTADSQRPIGDIELLQPDERMRILGDWNNTRYSVEPGLLLDGYRRAVRDMPDAIAVSDADIELTYAEFDARVNQLARLLISRDVGPETTVVAGIRPSLDLLIALYAILTAGGVYVPVDPDHPADRIGYILDTVRPVCVVSTVADAVPVPHDTQVLRLDTMDLSGFDPSPVRVQELSRPLRPGHPAYVIFTSGSTGRPKGVVVSHAAIDHQLAWMLAAYPLANDDVYLQKTPPTYDASLWGYFLPLRAGARLRLAAPGRTDPLYIAESIIAHGITVTDFVPSQLAGFADRTAPGICPTLREVFVIGEALPARVVAAFGRISDARVHNLYGPTEAAVSVTYWPAASADGSTVPIGLPQWNTRIYVLDDRLRPVPVGVPGELYLAGAALARGYADRSDLTADRFVADPFSQGDAGGRMYRTGDLVVWREGSGELPARLDFLGRTDFQINIRGSRIEPGEIEAALLAQSAVGDAVVVAREDRLVAYVQPRPAMRIVTERVAASLAEVLPEELIPDVVVPMDALPRTATGKLDRRALPDPSLGVQTSSSLKVVRPGFPGAARTPESSPQSVARNESGGAADSGWLSKQWKLGPTRGAQSQESGSLTELPRRSRGEARRRAEESSLSGSDRASGTDPSVPEEDSGSSRENSGADGGVRQSGWSPRVVSSQESGGADDGGSQSSSRSESGRAARQESGWSLRVVPSPGESDAVEENRAESPLRSQSRRESGWSPRVVPAPGGDHRRSESDSLSRSETGTESPEDSSSDVELNSIDAESNSYPTRGIDPASHATADETAVDREQDSRERASGLSSLRAGFDRGLRSGVGWPDSPRASSPGMTEDSAGTEQSSLPKLPSRSRSRTGLGSESESAPEWLSPNDSQSDVPPALPSRRPVADSRESIPPGSEPDAASRADAVPVPLSPEQQRIWLLERAELVSGAQVRAAYHLPFALRMTGSLDVESLGVALDDVITRHEVLRTVYPAVVAQAPDSPWAVQRVLPAEPRLPLVVHRIAGAEVSAAVRELAAGPLDVTTETPLRAQLFEISDLAPGSRREYVLALVVHRIAADSSAIGPIVGDLMAAYAARTANHSPRWAPPSAQYADYVRRQRSMLGSESDPESVAAQQIAYWRGELAGLPEVLDLPGARPRPAVSSLAGARIGIHIDAATHTALLELAHTHATTLFTVLQTAVAAYLARLSGGDDIAIGTPVPGRAAGEFEDLIGTFVNTVVLRTRPDAAESFSDLLIRQRDIQERAFAHADLPFARLVEAFGIRLSNAHHPLFQVGVSVQTPARTTVDLPGLTVEDIDTELEVSQLDLNLTATETYDSDGNPSGIEGRITYATDLFDHPAVETLASGLTGLLTALVAEPAQPLGAIGVGVSRSGSPDLSSRSARGQVPDTANSAETPGIPAISVSSPAEPGDMPFVLGVRPDAASADELQTAARDSGPGQRDAQSGNRISAAYSLPDRNRGADSADRSDAGQPLAGRRPGDPEPERFPVADTGTAVDPNYAQGLGTADDIVADAPEEVSGTARRSAFGLHSLRTTSPDDVKSSWAAHGSVEMESAHESVASRSVRGTAMSADSADSAWTGPESGELDSVREPAQLGDSRRTPVSADDAESAWIGPESGELGGVHGISVSADDAESAGIRRVSDDVDSDPEPIGLRGVRRIPSSADDAKSAELAWPGHVSDEVESGRESGGLGDVRRMPESADDVESARAGRGFDGVGSGGEPVRDSGREQWNAGVADDGEVGDSGSGQWGSAVAGRGFAPGADVVGADGEFAYGGDGFGAGPTLVSMLEEVVQAGPDAVGIIASGVETGGGATEFSVGELDARANRMARYLIALGVGRGSVVALAVRRSVDLGVALYAVAKAGGAALAVDPEGVGERNREILAGAGPVCVLADAEYPFVASNRAAGEGSFDAPTELLTPIGRTPAHRPAAGGQPMVVRVDRLNLEGIPTHRLDDAERIEPLRADHPAWVVQSGGTERVVVSHAGAVGQLTGSTTEFGLDADGRALLSTAASVDLSVWEFWSVALGSPVQLGEQAVRARTIPELMASAVEANPNGAAVVFRGRSFTYTQLDRASSKLARRLIQLGAGPEKPVAVAIPRSLEALVTLWSVAKTGAAVVAVEPSLPGYRITDMVSDSGAVLGVTVRAAVAGLPRIGGEWLVLDHPNFAAEVDAQAGEPISDAERIMTLLPDDGAYVLYGSTEVDHSQGIVVAHEDLADLAEQASHYRLHQDSRVLALAAPSSDEAVLELVLALGAAAALVVAPATIGGGPELARLIRSERVTHAFLPEAALRSVDPASLGGVEVVVTDRSVPAEDAAASESNPIEQQELSVLPDVEYEPLPADHTPGYRPSSEELDHPQSHRAEQPGYSEPAGYAEQPAYSEQPGYPEQPEHVGQPGYPESAGYSVRSGEPEQFGHSEGPGYRSRAEDFDRSESVGRSGYPESDVYPEQSSYSEQSENVGWSGYPESAGYAEQPGHAESLGYRSRADDFERSESFGQPGYSESAGYSERSGESQQFGYSEQSEPVGGSGYSESDVGSQQFGYSEGPGYRSRAEDFDRSESVGRSGYSESTTDSGQPRYSEESGYRDQPAYSGQTGDSGSFEQSLTPAERIIAEARAGAPPPEEFDSATALSDPLPRRERRAVPEAGTPAPALPRRGARAAEPAESRVPAEPVASVPDPEPDENGSLPLPPRAVRLLEIDPSGRESRAIAMDIPAGVPEERIRAAVRTVVHRHPLLSARLVVPGRSAGDPLRGWSAIFAGAAREARLVLARTPPETSPHRFVHSEGVADMAVRALAAQLDPAQGRNIGFGLIDPPESVQAQDGSRILVVAANGLFVDDVSWRIIVGELSRAWSGEDVALDDRVRGAADAVAHALAARAVENSVRGEVSWWQRELAGLPAESALDGVDLTARGRVSLVITTEGAAAVSAVAASYHAGVEDVLLTALALAFMPRTRAAEVLGPVVQLTADGRSLAGAESSRVVGGFTSTYPLVPAIEGIDLDDALSGGAAAGAAISGVKERRRAVPAGGVDYALLRYLDPDAAAEMSTLAHGRTAFRYRDLRPARPYPDTPAADLFLDIIVDATDEGFRVRFDYASAVLDADDVKELAGHWVRSLGGLAEHGTRSEAGGFTPSDFPMVPLTQDDIDRLLRYHPDLSDIRPVAPVQAGLLAAGQRTASAQFAVDLRGPLDDRRLRLSAQAVLDRHDGLRVAFDDWAGGPVQVVSGVVEISWRKLDFTDLEPADARVEAERYQAADRLSPFDPQDAPLLRFALLKTASTTHRVLLTAHPLLLDDRSLRLVMRDLLTVYARGPRSRLLPAVYSYRAQADWLAAQNGPAARAASREALSGYHAPALLGHADPEHEIASPTAEAGVELLPADAVELSGLATRLGVTVQMVVQAAWGLLLRQFADRDDVVFGVVAPGRSPQVPNVETLVGRFGAIVPVRVRPEPDELLEELLLRIRAEWSARPGYYCPSQADTARSLGVDRLFDSVVMFRDDAADLAELSGIVDGIRIEAVDSAPAFADRVAVAVVLNGPIRLSLRYLTEAVSESVANVLAYGLSSVIRQIAQEPHTRIADLDLHIEHAPSDAGVGR